LAGIVPFQTDDAGFAFTIDLAPGKKQRLRIEVF
jgi:hypothetical protein